MPAYMSLYKSAGTITGKMADVFPTIIHETLSQSSNMSSDLDEDSMRELENQARPINTSRATIYGVNKFQNWLKRRGKTCDFYSVSANDLNDLLRKFYAEVKPTDSGKQGSLSPSTLTCLRAAIHRFIRSPPYSRPFNIINDREFTAANSMFTARCKMFFKSGNRKPAHKPSIGEGDMQKLGEYFQKWNENPDILFESLWFFLCFFFSEGEGAKVGQQ